MSASLVDATHRYSWEVTKVKFENCKDVSQFIDSPNFTIDINGKESEWRLRMYPKGQKEPEKNKVVVSLRYESKNENYKVSYQVAVKTEDGYWPKDFVKEFYSRVSYDKGDYFGCADEDGDRKVSLGWKYNLCATEEFEKHFVENKITVVVSLVIYVEGDKYRNHMQVTDEFVGNIRSKVDESPELVETMLEFMSKGHIPEDIDDKAMELILMADKYGLDLLTIACETSLINNISPDNAVETLITIDKVKHVSKQEHRLKVLSYIKKEADQVVKSKDWKTFIQNYPDLITEAFLLKCSKKYGTCSS